MSNRNLRNSLFRPHEFVAVDDRSRDPARGSVRAGRCQRRLRSSICSRRKSGLQKSAVGALRSRFQEKFATEARRHGEIFFKSTGPFASCLGTLPGTGTENHRSASAKRWIWLDRYRSRRYSTISGAAHSAHFLVSFSPRGGKHAHGAAGSRPCALRAHLRFLITTAGRAVVSYQTSAISKKNSRARAIVAGTQPPS